LCNYYGFLLVGRHFGRQPLSFSASLLGGLWQLRRWRTWGREDTRNDMTFLIHSFGKVWSHYFTVFWRNKDERDVWRSDGLGGREFCRSDEFESDSL
jgi:hypothetical protein